MTNDSYLLVSYAGVLTLVVATAQACVRLLRGSLRELTESAGSGRLARLLQVCFPPSLMLPALTGMLSVSFASCSRSTYLEIVADRAYLVQKNQEQLMTSLCWLLGALVVWAIVCAFVLALGRRPRRLLSGAPRSSSSHSPTDRGSRRPPLRSDRPVPE